MKLTKTLVKNLFNNFIVAAYIAWFIFNVINNHVLWDYLFTDNSKNIDSGFAFLVAFSSISWIILTFIIIVDIIQKIEERIKKWYKNLPE